MTPRTTLAELLAGFTYRALAEQIERMAEQLRSAGLRSGDCVVIVLPNGLKFLVVFLAIASAGLVAAPLNPRLQKPMSCEIFLKIYSLVRSSSEAPISQLSKRQRGLT
jgi:acyl-CoA synthetase (AMP-forming)/AMP-acid ligase II